MPETNSELDKTWGQRQVLAASGAPNSGFSTKKGNIGERGGPEIEEMPGQSL